jgi:hypothetical protein
MEGVEVSVGAAVRVCESMLSSASSANRDWSTRHPSASALQTHPTVRGIHIRMHSLVTRTAARCYAEVQPARQRGGQQAHGSHASCVHATPCCPCVCGCGASCLAGPAWPAVWRAA